MSFTSDMGTELSLADFRLGSSELTALLPAWTNTDTWDLDVGESSMSHHHIGQPAAPFLLPQALTVPGMQHMVDNCCRDAHTEMKHWLKNHESLQLLEIFFTIEGAA